QQFHVQVAVVLLPALALLHRQRRISRRQPRWERSVPPACAASALIEPPPPSAAGPPSGRSPGRARAPSTAWPVSSTIACIAPTRPSPPAGLQSQRSPRLGPPALRGGA